jgi:hypothetical protein
MLGTRVTATRAHCKKLGLTSAPSESRSGLLTLGGERMIVKDRQRRRRGHKALSCVLLQDISS